jgi:GNAT superfamily N-acetyltransferase
MKNDYLEILDNNYAVRFANSRDIDELAAFQVRNQENEDCDRWVRGMMVNKYCSPEPDRFLILEDTANNKIASSLAIIPSISCYRGQPFRTARIDLVSTDPSYRNQGFARHLFKVAHKYFEANNIHVNCVIGRPWYYTQFGEYAVARPNEEGKIYSGISKELLTDENASKFKISDALESDLEFCGDLYRKSLKRHLLSRYMYNEQFASSANFPDGVKIIETEQGERIGFVVIGVHGLDQSNLPVYLMEIIDSALWSDVKSVVLDYFIQCGERIASKSNEIFQGVSLVLGKEHPFYNVLPEASTIPMRGFPGYIQINDLIGFFNHITGVLEQRIQNSAMASYSGSLSINLWKKMRGIVFEFESGRMISVKQCSLDDGDFNISQQSLTQLIFGWKALDELLIDYPEVGFQREEVDQLIRILFPKEASFIPF